MALSRCATASLEAASFHGEFAHPEMSERVIRVDLEHLTEHLLAATLIGVARGEFLLRGLDRFGRGLAAE